jgi:hypothetical protein
MSRRGSRGGGGGSRGGGSSGRSRSSSPSSGSFGGGSRGGSFGRSRSPSPSRVSFGGSRRSRSFAPRYSRPYTGSFYRGYRRPFRVWPHYYSGYGFPSYYGSRYPYFPFILDLYRPWYRPIITPIIIDTPIVEDSAESPEQQVRDDLINGSTVGEVSLAFGDISKFSGKGLQEEVDRINEIIRETNYWTSFQEGGQTFIAITNTVGDEAEFIAKKRTTIQGNPTLYLNRHNGNVSDNALMDFIATSNVPPENILYYSPQ